MLSVVFNKNNIKITKGYRTRGWSVYLLGVNQYLITYALDISGPFITYQRSWQI